MTDWVAAMNIQDGIATANGTVSSASIAATALKRGTMSVWTMVSVMSADTAHQTRIIAIIRM